jgi:hypothetical protein
MAPDNVPIYAYVQQKYGSAAVQRLVEGWRLESKVIIDRIVDHFRDMGIYTVSRQNEVLIVKGILHQLRHSPEILRLVVRANLEEQRRTRSRHESS